MWVRVPPSARHGAAIFAQGPRGRCRRRPCMPEQRRHGGLPLAVYVVALLVIPLTAVGWFSIREVDRNDIATERSVSIADAVAESSAAAATLIPLEIEQLASLGLVDSSEGSADADVFRRSSTMPDREVDQALDDARRDASARPRRRTPRRSRRSVRPRCCSTPHADVSTTASPDDRGVESAYEVVADQATDALAGSGTVLSTIDYGSTDVVASAINLDAHQCR